MSQLRPAKEGVKDVGEEEDEEEDEDEDEEEEEEYPSVSQLVPR